MGILSHITPNTHRQLTHTPQEDIILLHPSQSINKCHTNIPHQATSRDIAVLGFNHLSRTTQQINPQCHQLPQSITT